MSYENLKEELVAILHKHYQGDTSINDIRGALHVVDLMAEQLAAIQLMEIAKSMANKPEAEVKREP